MRARINGQWWDVQFSKQLKDYGHCEVTRRRRGKPRRVIKLRSRQPDAALVDTLVHEILHAYYWDILSEHAVTHSARDIARLLNRVFEIRRRAETGAHRQT